MFEWDGDIVPEFFTDKLNQSVYPGDYIAYSTVSGSSPNLNIGRIIEFRTHGPDGNPYEARGYDRDTREYYPRPFYKLKVQPVIGGHWGIRSDEGARPVYLTESGTVIKVSVDLVNDLPVYE